MEGGGGREGGGKKGKRLGAERAEVGIVRKDLVAN